MFRKLPASGSVAAGNVEAAEVLGLCDKMPALGASMLPEAVRIQSFAVALEAAAGEAAAAWIAAAERRGHDQLRHDRNAEPEHGPRRQ